jgi:mRNA interferase MazF
MNFKPGYISLVRFPRANLQSGKYRPVLLLSRMPDDFKPSGLKVPSLIRIGKLATVEEEVLESMLGEISSERLMRILKRLMNHLERVRRGDG